MRIKIPRFSWIKVLDDNGILIREECVQKEMVVITEDHNVSKSDSEISECYATMAHEGKVLP